MTRTQFTFYESFFKAVKRIRKASDRAAAYDAICAYALYGTEPDMEALPESVAIAFEVVRPNLDSSRRKSENGKRGGRGKKSESKPEANESKPEADESKPKANRKQEKEEEKEEDKDKEKDKDKEQMLSPVAPLSAVLSAYMNKINPQPSETCVAELKGFVLEMGKEVCMRAIDIALDERKTSWSYVRAILRTKQEQGVRCIADWDRLDDERLKRQSQLKGRVSFSDLAAEMGGPL